MEEQQQTKVNNASTVLGILSICLFFTTWPGMVLGIIGLSIKKREHTRTKDITLNTIGLVLSTIWLLYVISYMGV